MLITCSFLLRISILKRVQLLSKMVDTLKTQTFTLSSLSTTYKCTITFLFGGEEQLPAFRRHWSEAAATIHYSCNNRQFLLSADDRQVPTPTSQNLEVDSKFGFLEQNNSSIALKIETHNS
jgi:hypothetical protein